MSNDYSLKGLDITSREFINAFYTPEDKKLCLRVLKERKDSAFSGTNIDVLPAERFGEYIATLEKHNSDNRGIFLVINKGGHIDRDITRINAQFVEMDNLPLEEQLAKIQAFPLEPSLIVKTRKSLHAYWLMRKAKVEDFRHIQRQLVSHFDGDSACVNESRVMRIPGFYHCKQEPVMVECIKFNPELRYTQNQLAEHLPEIVRDDSHKTKIVKESSQIIGFGMQKGIIRMGRECRFFKHCKTNAKTLPEPIWYAMITNAAVFEGGSEAIHSLSKPHDKYTFEETEAKIVKFHKTGTKPMTCRKIAELGFKCPNLESGKCKAKSPAGLAFFPMPMGEIRRLLTNTKTTAVTLDNVSVSRNFINNYLYNIDAGLAETLINNEFKSHFNFKAAELKLLVSYHKDVHNAFANTQRNKRDTRGNELPSWYRFKKNGSLHFMQGVLADYLAVNHHVIYCGDSYYFYENGVYVPKEDIFAENYVRTFMEIDTDKTSSQISDAENQWRMQILTPVWELNANPYIINCKNGVYNVFTKQLSEHNPAILSSIRINANYDENAECPAFLKFIDDALPKSEHKLIQELLGYVLVPISQKKSTIKTLSI
ncbi:MAG: hypothetical protein FWH07_02550 [Oscillospiraceae bacterium]|nr:hypothetical protein [Oscillospiraceae bacterium]